MKSQKYLDIFAREAEEHLQILRQGCLALEKDGFSPERIHLILRSAHTLKGSARMLDLGEIGDVSHAMEDLLKDLEKGVRALTPALVDLLLTTTDVLEQLTRQAQGEESVSFSIESIIEGLRTGVLKEQPNLPTPAGDDAVSEVSTVRIGVARLDQLVNQLGELRINQLMLEERGRQLASSMKDLERFIRRLRRAENTRALREIQTGFARLAADYERDLQNLNYLAQDLHHSAMELRMLPLGTITGDLGVMVRNLAREQGKEILLSMSGEDVELDRMMLEALKPMLLHMLRNAIDHGIEEPFERIGNSKPPAGRIDLQARYEAGFVHLILNDDGRGIDPATIRRAAVKKGLLSESDAAALTDEEAVYLILRPGFSTREFITDVSGRGVGMDVVKSNIDRVKGNLVIHSKPGEGTTIHLQIPLTLAVFDALLVVCSGQTLALPLHYVSQILRLSERDIVTEGGREVVRVHGHTLPLVSMATTLGLPAQAVTRSTRALSALVLSFREQQLVCLVDRTIGVLDVVVKGLGKQLKSVEFFSGVTILGDGSPALILSVPDLFASCVASRTGTQLRQEFAARRAEMRKGRILVVDDSITTRTMEKNILETHGYDVTVAVSGHDALSKLTNADFDLIVSDVEMPGMTGFELTARLRQLDQTRETPVIIVTSLSSDEHRRKGLEVGAQAYIVKGSFDQGTLLETVQTLIG